RQLFPNQFVKNTPLCCLISYKLLTKTSIAISQSLEERVDFLNYLKQSFEDVVITATIIIGLVGGVILILFTNVVPVVVAIFFALALTAFTYRFLGGIDEQTSFTIGALKLTGTAAVLIGSIWFIDYRFVEETKHEILILPDNFAPGEVYLFDETGKPVRRTAFKLDGDDTTDVTFPKLPPDKFKEQAARKLQVENERMYIKTGNDSTYLGFINENRDSVTHKILPSEHALALGMYYSQAKDSQTKERNNPHEAIDFLSNVLESKNSNVRQKRDARKQLYHLQQNFTKPEEFEILIAATRDFSFPSSEYAKFLELGETYLAYSQKFDKNKQLHKMSALINFLSYLGTSQSERDKKTRDRVGKTVNELVTIELPRHADIQPRKQEILTAVKEHDRSQITQFQKELSSALISNK
ncbi:MAG: hypothetical protein ACE5I1_31795, partial [bacterium]